MAERKSSWPARMVSTGMKSPNARVWSGEFQFYYGRSTTHNATTGSCNSARVAMSSLKQESAQDSDFKQTILENTKKRPLSIFQELDMSLR